jgi:hypothetical protein
MNETTSHKSEVFVFRRLSDPFEQFTDDTLATLIGNPISLALLALLLLFVVARVVYHYAHPTGRSLATRDATALGIVWGAAFWVVPVLGAFAATSGLVTLKQDWWYTQYLLAAVLAVVALACFLTPLALVGVGGWNAVRYLTSPNRPAGDVIARGLAWGIGLVFANYVVWCLAVFYAREFLADDASRAAAEAAVASTMNSGNAAKWLSFTGAVFVLGCVFVVLMYIKDTRTVSWFWALPLAFLRAWVYAILCFVFLLPAMQTWEDTNKQSRVVILLDISPSVTDPRATDEIVTGPGRKAKTRMDLIIEFLTDEKVAFIKGLLEKNPVAVYTFGTRLDESPTSISQADPAWTKSDWEALARYDFKPFVLRGLSEEGQAQLKKHGEWNGEAPGTVEWAATWFARRGDPELQKNVGLSSADDAEKLKKNLERLDKRIDVARTIALGTNVPDSITAAVNREAPNMVQGIIVFSDGRSNLGSDSSYLELRDRAAREKIPVFTIAVGEDRQPASITNLEVQVSDSIPIDEASKIIVEADGVNMANKEVEVFLDLFKPGNVPPKDQDALEKGDLGAPDETLTTKMVFAPGDPPHGQVEFVIDPAKLKEALTTESKDAAIKKRVLIEGKWSVRARIAKEPQEAYPYDVHIRTRPDINAVQQKLRILLVADAPGREFTFLRTLLVREVQDKRASLSTYVQNEAGKGGKLTPEKDEVVLLRFPTRFDLADKNVLPEDKPYNLNEYDVIIAFDPDWSELTQQQADDLGRWVKEGGGGFIYCAGPINTFQLARVEENSGRLIKLLEVLPVLPADIVAQRIKPIPKTPRRLKLYPERIIGSELLKLDDKAKDDPVAGWELFFTDREKYVPSMDLKEELFPRRGFYSAYPVKEVKPGSAVLAEFMDQSDTGDAAPSPWIVTNNPSAAYRTAYLGSPEFYRMRSYDPENKTGQEYFERFWIKLVKYMAAKRNIKAPRGRVLVSKEGVSGAPLRVQARILDQNAKPYPREGGGAIGPKFRVVQEAANGEKREFGPFDLAPKQSAAGDFDGYYAGQVLLDPKQFPPGDFIYRVEIDVPDSPGEMLKAEFRVRKSDPEMDNTRPDFPAMLKMASDFDKDFQARLTDKVKIDLGKTLPKEGGVQRLAFKLADKEGLRLIPECMITRTQNNQNRGPVNDLWDKPVYLDMTRSPVLNALYAVFGALLALILGRVLWGFVANSLPGWLHIVIFVLWVLAGVVSLALFGIVVLIGAHELGFLWVLSCALFGIAIVTYRAESRVGLMILGSLALLTAAVAAGIRFSDYTGAVTPISIVLLVVSTILGVEWVSRKLLRLA